jgi:hypothetical protein
MASKAKTPARPKPKAKAKRPAARPRRKVSAAAQPAPEALPVPVLAQAAPDGDDRFGWFMLAVLFGLYFYGKLYLISQPWGGPTYYYKFYASALFGVVPAALLSLGAVRLAARLLLRGNANVLPLLLLPQAVFWAWFCSRPYTVIGTMPELTLAWALPPKLILGSLAAAWLSGKERRPLWTRALRLSCLASGPIAMIVLWHFRADILPAPWILAGFVLAALFLTAIVAIPRSSERRPWGAWDWIAVVLIALALAGVGPFMDVYHQDCFIGPANAVLRGRTMLHDVLCEYGVTNIYFLALVFKLTGLKPVYQPLSVILIVLTVLEYLLMYWMARKAYLSRFLAFFAVAVAFCFNRCGSFTEWDNLVYPSIGPLRFGLPMLLVAAGYLRKANGSKAWGRVELALLGLASIWSIETSIYCLSAWCFSTGSEIIGQAESVPGALLTTLKRVAGALFAIAVAYAALYLFTYLRSGEWPNWDMYLAWINVYASGAAAWPLNPLGPYIVMPATACLSFMALIMLGREPSMKEPSVSMIAGLSGAAAAEFSYYIQRSHPNNLGHVAPLFVLVFFYWLDRAWARPQLSGRARWSATPAAFIVVVALLWNASDAINLRFGQSMLAYAGRDAVGLLRGQAPQPFFDFYHGLWDPKPYAGPTVGPSVELIKRYAGGQKRVGIFAPRNVEIHSLTETDDPLPIADIDEERWVRPHFNMDTEPDAYHAGDFILVGQDPSGGYTGDPVLPDNNGIDLHAQLNYLRARFKIVPLEPVATGGVWPMRLEALDAAPTTATASAPPPSAPKR